MLEPFRPSRLRLAREQRGLFIQEVAARAAVSSRSVSAWENGTTVPAEPHIATLAEVLGVPRDFFSGAEPAPLPVVLFRNQGRLTARQRDMALAAGVHAVAVETWLATLAERPLPALPDLGAMSPEAAAMAVREQWQLGADPVPPIISLLERFGVRVYSLGYPGADVDAYSLWYGPTPFVLLNVAIPSTRRRMCAAHELGHLVLHASTSGHGSRKLEVEADAFAAAFLMPAATVLERAPRAMTIEAIDDARRAWAVPARAYLRRLYDLDRLPEWRFRALCTQVKFRSDALGERDAQEDAASPFLASCLTSAEHGAAREAGARHLRVCLADLDAITFAPAVALGA